MTRVVVNKTKIDTAYASSIRTRNSTREINYFLCIINRKFRNLFCPSFEKFGGLN